MAYREIQANTDRTILEWVEKNEQKIIDVSKQLWDNPEILYEEVESAKLLSGWLEENGFTLERGVANIPTAFVATYTNGDGPAIGILGEYDALPGVGVEIAPVNKPTGKNGHACGHNLYGAGSCAAAIAVKQAMQEGGIHGTIKMFGCPAEEGGGAKVFMTRDGVFDGMDAIITWHPANASMCTQASSLAIYSVKYRFHGRAAHAGVTPHLGRSALDAAILMDVGVQFLREHMPISNRIHSVITNGGVMPNVVPDYAEIWYNLRAPTRADVDVLFDRVLNIAKGMALSTDTTVEVHKEARGCSSNNIANAVLSEVALENLKKVGGPKFTDEDWAFAKQLNAEVTNQEKIENMRMMYAITDEHATDDLYDGIGESMLKGTTAPYSGDSGDVSWQVPYCQYSIACQTVGTGNHSWQQTVCAGSHIGQAGMICAAKALACAAAEFMGRPELIEAAWAEHRKKLEAYPYTSPLPAGVTPFDND